MVGTLSYQPFPAFWLPHLDQNFLFLLWMFVLWREKGKLFSATCTDCYPRRLVFVIKSIELARSVNNVAKNIPSCVFWHRANCTRDIALTVIPKFRFLTRCIGTRNYQIFCFVRTRATARVRKWEKGHLEIPPPPCFLSSVDQLSERLRRFPHLHRTNPSPADLRSNLFRSATVPSPDGRPCSFANSRIDCSEIRLFHSMEQYGASLNRKHNTGFTDFTVSYFNPIFVLLTNGLHNSSIWTRLTIHKMIVISFCGLFCL